MRALPKFTLLMTIAATSFGWAQVRKSIIIKDYNNQVIKNAVVSINDQQQKTDNLGRVQFDLKIEDDYTLQIFADNYRSVLQTYSTVDLIMDSFYLEVDNTILSDIILETKDEQKNSNRGIIRAVTVDTKSEVLRSTSLNDMMNKTTGVRVRQGGGLGSETSINLNGFQGNAIRFFKDGIPLNYLGQGYNLSNVPLDVLDKVEVYKGIIPVHLASDALGGAVNLISSNVQANQLRASAEYGSFNTVRSAVRGHYNFNDHLYAGGEVFYNYSDNDYKINNPDTELTKTHSKVRLFHNRYKHFYANAYVGVNNLLWTDKIELGLSYYNIDKQLQNSPTSMAVPYGGIQDKQHSVIPTLRYKKQLFNDKLSIDQFLSYNVVKSQAIDTLKGRYNWLGEFTPRGYRGEGDMPMDADIDMTFFTSRTLIGYKINPSHQLWLNNTYNYTKREGNDPYGRVIQDLNQTVIELPTRYKKNVLAVGITSQWFGTKLETNAIMKLYNYSSRGLNTASNVDLSARDIHEVSDNALGWALGLKYKLNDQLNLRFSIEDARRLPGYTELFGDYIFIASNFNLKPEQSVNLNLGIEKEVGNFQYSFNSFFRHTKDIVVLVSGNPPLSVYVNKEKANGYGFEGDLSLKVAKHYKFYGNFTWQSIRYDEFKQAADKWLKGNRVPNIPYFFANVGAEAKFDNVISKQDRLTAYANLNFVREFYIQPIDKSMEPDGFLGLFGKSKGDVKNIVPDQTSLTLGTLYELKKDGVSIGVEVRNLLNQDLYDYFKIQKAGRSIYLKLNYKLN
ncbi:TonB-dependent receptor domain-containing protein [Myroides sp.]|uniref:TonB-dependent receptor domain-containing protein n=1 Tax=Myroides sp. TaxID=1874736 RepID=UPI003F2B78D6